MQRLYRILFNSIYEKTKQLSDSIKNLIIVASCLLLMWTYFFGSIDVVSEKLQVRGTILFIIITIFSIKGPFKILRWNRFIIYPMTAFGSGILIINMFHPVGEGYVVFAIDLLVVFPAFYYVWANRGDYKMLYRLLSSAIMLLGVASFAYCYYLAFRGELHFNGVRMAGFRANANTFGRLGVMMVIANIFLVWTNLDKFIVILCASAGVGIGASYLILSSSRTSFLMILISLVILVIRLVIEEGERITTKKALQLLCSLGICSILLMVGLMLNDINYNAVEKNKEKAPTAVEVDENTKSAPDATTGEIKALTNRMKEQKDLNTFSSGRIHFWKIFLTNSKFLGSELAEIEKYFPNRRHIWAHNNVVEYLFRCGYIVGAIYLFLFIFQGLAGIRMLFDRRYSGPCAFFTVSAIAMFSLLAMLDVATLPFAGGIPCIYYMAISPIMFNVEK